MSHKTMIDGVAYEISGGKTLVGGTAYSIKNGKTLIDGTAYEVGFGKTVMVTVERGVYPYYNSEYARVTINGIVYDGSETVEIPVEVGTIIECYIFVQNTTTAGIQVDKEDKVTATGTYKHTVTSNCKIDICYWKMSFGNQIGGIINITNET